MLVVRVLGLVLTCDPPSSPTDVSVTSQMETVPLSSSEATFFCCWFRTGEETQMFPRSKDMQGQQYVPDTINVRVFSLPKTPHRGETHVTPAENGLKG